MFLENSVLLTPCARVADNCAVGGAAFAWAVKSTLRVKNVIFLLWFLHLVIVPEVLAVYTYALEVLIS